MKTIYIIRHFIQLLWIPVLLITVLPVFWFCMYITKGDVKYPEDRAKVIKKVKRFYPNNFIKDWLVDFEHVKKGY